MERVARRLLGGAESTHFTGWRLERGSRNDGADTDAGTTSKPRAIELDGNSQNNSAGQRCRRRGGVNSRLSAENAGRVEGGKLAITITLTVQRDVGFLHQRRTVGRSWIVPQRLDLHASSIKPFVPMHAS